MAMRRPQPANRWRAAGRQWKDQAEAGNLSATETSIYVTLLPPPPPKGESLTSGVALSIGNSSSSNSNTYNNNICSHAISVTCHSSKHCIAKPKGIVSRYCLLALPQQQQKRRQACPSACHTRLKLLKQCSCLPYGMRDVSI